jgi:hypothetical protein
MGKVLDSVHRTALAEVPSDLSWRLERGQSDYVQRDHGSYTGGLGAERTWSSSSGSSIRRKAVRSLEMEKGTPGMS